MKLKVPALIILTALVLVLVSGCHGSRKSSVGNAGKRGCNCGF